VKLFINSNGTPQGTHVATGYGQRIEGVQSVTLEANVGDAFLVATIKVLIDPQNISVNAPKKAETYYKDKQPQPGPKEVVPVPLAATNTHRCPVCKALVFHADACPHSSKKTSPPPVIPAPASCYWCGAIADRQGLTYHADSCPQKPAYRTEAGDAIVPGSTQVSVDKVTVPVGKYNIYKVPSNTNSAHHGPPAAEYTQKPQSWTRVCDHCGGRGYLSKKYSVEDGARFGYNYPHANDTGTYTVVCKDCKGSGWL